MSLILKNNVEYVKCLTLSQPITTNELYANICKQLAGSKWDADIFTNFKRQWSTL